MILISFRHKRLPFRSVSGCSRLLNYLYRKQSENYSAIHQYIYWYTSINYPSSLVLYRYFKSTFGYENYLDYLSDINKKIFVRLRLSSSQLNAVTGRFRNNIRSTICNICNLHDVEDEYHFILICPAYYNIR